jgi:DNA-binding PadR family transcriptional regulator
MLKSQPPRKSNPLDECLLRSLLTAPASGHLLTKRLRAAENQAILYAARATYVRLHRLERDGLLTSEWRPVAGRQLKAKYYRLTPVGVRSLALSNVARPPTSTIDPFTVLVILAVFGAAKTAHATEESRQPALTIFVTCRVPIPIADLRRASMDVTRILGVIRVKADWVLEEPSSRPSAQSPVAGVVVHVVIDSRPPLSLSSDEVFLGMTSPSHPEGSAEIVLFQDPIQQAADFYQRALSSVLALVVAHEIGHVLLPSPAHSNTGITQAPWDSHAMDQADRNQLVFTARQGDLMRQRLNHCCAVVSTP